MKILHPNVKYDISFFRRFYSFLYCFPCFKNKIDKLFPIDIHEFINSFEEQSNFINVPMLNQGIKQLNTWGVNNIQEYCKNITKEGLKTIDKNKIWYEEDDYRAWHLFGLFPKKNLKKILKKIREKNIHISLRGETIRVSPNVYNNKRDLEKFFNTISKNI